MVRPLRRAYPAFGQRDVEHHLVSIIDPEADLLRTGAVQHVPQQGEPVEPVTLKDDIGTLIRAECVTGGDGKGATQAAR